MTNALRVAVIAVPPLLKTGDLNFSCTLDHPGIRNILMQETERWQVQCPGWELPLEEGMATHSSILAWRIPWTEEPGGLQSMGSQRVGHNCSDLARMHTYLTLYWEGINNTKQYVNNLSNSQEMLE